MASSQTIVADQNTLEDPLAYLTCSSIVEHKKGTLIYHQDQPSTSIYLVIDGRVKVARIGDDGRQTIIDIYRTDEFFGESALLGLPRRAEQAIALENTKLMAWTAAEIHTAAQMRPSLAIALLQIVLQRSLEYEYRLESLSTDTTARRLARTLIRLSQKMGAPEPDGSYRMAPFTHELLGQYVGTSREIVSHYMNVFRRLGCLRYSRQEIVVFRDAFDAWLHRTGVHAVKAVQPPRAAASGSFIEPAILKRA